MPDLTPSTIRACLVAHAIRLGKCPSVGQIMGCNLQLMTAQADDVTQIDAGIVPHATPQSEKVAYAFEVTDEDIAAAKRLINEQAAQYKEPKQTIVRLQ